MRTGAERWSSKLGFYLAAPGAAVGLGSIWRFPYMTGSNGGSAFVFVFILACLAIATPLLVAEFMIGRRSRRNPAEGAGEVASSFGRSRRWNVIGVLGTAAAFFVMSYYTVIAGWVLAYAGKCVSGEITALPRAAVELQFNEFLSNPWRVGEWHLAFVVLVGSISARGMNRGIELANKIRRSPPLGPVLAAICLSARHCGGAGDGTRVTSWPCLRGTRSSAGRSCAPRCVQIRTCTALPPRWSAVGS